MGAHCSAPGMCQALRIIISICTQHSDRTVEEYMDTQIGGHSCMDTERESRSCLFITIGDTQVSNVTPFRGTCHLPQTYPWILLERHGGEVSCVTGHFHDLRVSCPLFAYISPPIKDGCGPSITLETGKCWYDIVSSA